MQKADFDELLKSGEFNRRAAAEEAARRASEDLKHAQQGSRIGCEQ
jgi:hypothetical protein